MTERVPAAVGVIFAEHVADAPVPDSVHEPLGVNVTVPVGVIAVPAAVSVTVAVHVVACPITTVVGAHETLVVVVLRLTVTVAAALVLPEWDASPLYVPAMLAVPAVDGVNVLVHVAVPVAPATNVHVVKVPVTPVTVKDTVPVGVDTGAVESVTVAVHVEPWLTKTGVVHETVVVVA